MQNTYFSPTPLNYNENIFSFNKKLILGLYSKDPLIYLTINLTNTRTVNMTSNTSIFPIDPDTPIKEIRTIIRLHQETIEQSFWVPHPNVLPAVKIRLQARGAINEARDLLNRKLRGEANG